MIATIDEADMFALWIFAGGVIFTVVIFAAFLSSGSKS